MFNHYWHMQKQSPSGEYLSCASSPNITFIKAQDTYVCCHFVWQANSSRADTAIVLHSYDSYCWSPQARFSSEFAEYRDLKLTPRTRARSGYSPRREASCWYTIKCLLKFNLEVSAASVNLADWVMTAHLLKGQRGHSRLSSMISLFFVREYQNKM